MHSIVRHFRTHSGYVAMSSAVLTVSVGVNLLVFTVVNALWLRPLPYPEPGRLVTIPQTVFTALDRLHEVFEGGVAGQVLTVDGREALRIPLEVAGQPTETLGITPDYFNVLRLIVRGRDFAVEDDQQGADPVAIISDRLWSRAFGRRSDAIGSILTTTPMSIRLIGVAPAGFGGVRRGERTDIWIPTSLVRKLAPPDWTGMSLPLMLVARLGPGQTVSMVERRYRELFLPPRLPSLFELPTVTPLTDVFGTPQTRTIVVREGNLFLVAAGLATLVLLGGCATIAALILMHYERRRGEFALKVSLGASRRRLVWELLRDLSSIGATGCAGGVLAAALGVRMLPALSLPGGVDIGRLNLSMDWRVTTVGLLATALVLLVAAALPIARSTRPRLAGDLLAGPSTATLASVRTRQHLLALQACAAVIVLIAAGLFIRAVLRGFGDAAGFDVDRMAYVSVQGDASFHEPTGDPGRLVARSIERTGRLMSILRGVPGVVEVAQGISPIGPDALRSLSGRPLTLQVHDQQFELPIGLLRGSPNLLSTLGVPIVAGRALSSADSVGVPQPAVITGTLAKRLWPAGGALGETLSVAQVRGGPFIVVGIARDLAFGSLTTPVSGVVVVAGLDTSATAHFVVRTDRPDIVSALIERTVKGHVVQTVTGREIIARDIGRQRLGAWFFSGFGVAALMLGVGGAFGLVAYLAESQRREFGVRLALGADLRHLVRHGVIAAVGPASAGVAAGLVLGGIASQTFKALLVGVGTLDVVTYVAVAITMLSCSTIAALAAAWRLRRTSPSDALRTT